MVGQALVIPFKTCPYVSSRATKEGSIGGKAGQPSSERSSPETSDVIAVIEGVRRLRFSHEGRVEEERSKLMALVDRGREDGHVPRAGPSQSIQRSQRVVS